MICKACFPKDREDVISLWGACFGDDRQYIEFFLDNIPKENVLFVYKKEGNIAGMFFLMPSRFRYELNCIWYEKDAYYVYAVGVAVEYRSCGIAGKMLEFAKAYANERGAELFLIPASESLAAYYGARGFRVLDANRQTLQAAENISFAENRAIIKMSNIDDEQGIDKYIEVLYCKRNEILQSECALLWGMDNFRFALKEHIYTGGTIYIFTAAVNSEGPEYIIWEKDAEKSRIREVLSQERILGNADFRVMITTMNYGRGFLDALKENDGLYINFCFN